MNVPFAASRVSALPIYRRQRTEDLVNLFSNELQHLAVDNVIAGALIRLPSNAVSRYPAPAALLDTLGAALVLLRRITTSSGSASFSRCGDG